MVTTGCKLGTQKKNKTETGQVNSTEKDAKENREISHNLLNEFNIKAINSETRYR